MEDTVSSSDKSGSPARCELLILHTAEAQEWATYLQKILKSSRKFPKRSILMYAVSLADQLHGYNFESFQSSKCIVLLLTAAFLDLLNDPALWDSLERLLHPPHRVVVLLCGVSEEDVLPLGFEHWSSWRKLHTEEEPAVYISTILESIADSRQHSDVQATADSAEPQVTPATLTPSPVAEETVQTVQTESVGTRETVLTCLTVQPNRVPCGDPVTIFIILKNKVDAHSNIEVEFSSSENAAAKRVPGTLENEYTISVAAPDMPVGEVLLTIHTDQASEALSPVTYYTNMEQVNFYLQNATNPIEFLRQAFNITSNVTESLDDMLTDSLKSRMPATGLHLFGIRQIKEAAYQQNLELPTLLHFAARFGLKKLSTVLLQCPGALQAYSVMNKYGEYPNTLAQRSGFLDLRQFMDDFVETADMVKTHLKVSNPEEEGDEVYEDMMRAASEDVVKMHSSCSEDIYESMVGIDPERAEDLYEAMNSAGDNSEEAVLRKFFQANPGMPLDDEERLAAEEKDEENPEEDEEEDPYNLNPEDIYDSVDGTAGFIQDILNRPPAPIPRPQFSERVEGPYITSVFPGRSTAEIAPQVEGGSFAVRSGRRPSSPVYDPYGGMKTPGQRQLIALQEKVKVGIITVEEAVQEFKSWQFDHERRSNSLRYQQENLKSLRDSIMRRHKEKERSGKDVGEYEITGPLPKNYQFDTGVYDSTPRAPPPAVTRPIQRGTWKTGSTSSTSSTESNRLSTHSTMSYSSGTEPEFEDALDSVPTPTRPPRPTSDVPPLIPPPRIPPRIPERVPENTLNERYSTCPTRVLPQRPARSRGPSPPPIPRRNR